ncbi:MAG: aminotransferase class I/II-fold pyridoxal phosphate-dependent enzyme [bacterium]
MHGTNKLPAKELAILGGAPAFAEPLHVGRPNIGDREALMHRIGDIIDRRWLSNNGPMVQEFEQKVAQFLGVKHCVAMCNGTIALEIAIRALGLHGEVIVPSYTFIATAHALQWQEITPVFADIDPATHNLDPAAVERMITPRTTGILGVHLWGRPAPIEALQEIAGMHRLQLLFDASHAFGCTHGGRSIGQFGRCEVFSFHATKFFNTFEGGAVVTNDDELARKMRLMKNFGFAGYDNVIYPGTNGKMTEVCAAMGLTGLESIGEFISVNKRNYHAYMEHLREVPGLSLVRYDEREHCNYQYIIVEVLPDSCLTRDDIVRILHAENVLVRKYFWPGCHNMQPYRDRYPQAGDFLPNTNEVASRVIVFPTGTAVEPETIRVIVAVLHTAVRTAPAVLRALGR